MSDPAKPLADETLADRAEPTAPPKADPETLVLRASPGRIVRFRRGAIIAIAAFGSIAIIGVAWMALQPASLSVFDAKEDVVLSPPPDTLADLPADYADVPQLGPPLPGDLGKPILDRQRELGLAPEDVDAEAARAAQEAEAERQRVAAEALAARESSVMMPLASALGAAATPPTNAAAIAPPTSTGIPSTQPDLNPPTRQEAFLANADDEPDISTHRLLPPASPYTLAAGSVIAASLLTELNSDLPGFVTAQVTSHVYDSVTGRILLIPQGSRLIGRYDSQVAFGQDRALIAWQRLMLPDGSSIRLDNLPATDASGQAGLADRVDNYGGRLVRGVALSTLLGVGTQVTLDDESELVRALRESTQQNTSRAGERIVERELDVEPTITVRPGWPLRMIVHRDLVLQPWQAWGG
ncbi:TrbI/VirB10 family protein [Erythrobacter rubeus]|uniref:TrbI/VirB10 family protein n=1 Tax=Erythrobacter rubeus TaxID=2760803 RepID=A0ABR8KWT0_9SPHN|nr:TrbI/VirB10 family protein [Erythrobacter rubeus]MBD2843528.1 TrbI/VirB10 family protein [Erythrobacter rubeus]